jgi:hypothetical protein
MTTRSSATNTAATVGQATDNSFRAEIAVLQIAT